MGKIKKQWISSGKQDKFIEKLIKQRKVNKFTKPSTLQITYPSLFSGFSVNVIRNHLNVLKRINGLHLDKKDEHQVKKQAYADFNATTTFCHQNYPILCETYKDPENQNDKVVMAVSLPGGAQNVKIELNDDGTAAIIKYTWSKTMFDVEDLSKKQLATKQIHVHHPKILCLKKGLEKVRKRFDMAPNSLIKEDGTQEILAEFNGYTKSYNKK